MNRRRLKNQHQRIVSLVVDYWDDLKKLYPSTVYVEIDYTNPSYSGMDLTYGEMSTEGLQTMIMKHQLYDYPVFIDMGAGQCKLPFYAAGFSHIESSIGIELVEERISFAKELQTRLANSHSGIVAKINIIQSDMLKVNLTDLAKQRKTLVWISNLCFGPELTRRIFDKLYEELPNQSIVSCSYIPENMDPKKFEAVAMESITMSWTSNSPVYMYKITK
jgi:hypothetical protein